MLSARARAASKTSDIGPKLTKITEMALRFGSGDTYDTISEKYVQIMRAVLANKKLATLVLRARVHEL